MKPSRAEYIFNKVRKRLFGRELDHIKFMIYDPPKPHRHKGAFSGTLGGYSKKKQYIRVARWFLEMCSIRRFYAVCIHELVHAKVYTEGHGHGYDFAVALLKYYRMIFSKKETYCIAKRERWSMGNGKLHGMLAVLRYHKLSID